MLRNKLPNIRINAEFGTPDFETEVDRPVCNAPNREKLGMSGMDKIVAFDQSASFDEFTPLLRENSRGTLDTNKVITLRSNFEKKRL
jgi:hypothetical protein